MKVLAIDSSTNVMGVAVTDNGMVLAEYLTQLKLNHSVRLMPAIGQVMEEVGMSPKELDRIAVSKGPGSYTGIRIGVSIAKTLAWTLDKELVGVSTLACLAQNGSQFPGLLVPFLDARRDRVYTGLYKKQGDKIESIEEDQIAPVEIWLEKLAATDEPCFFIGQDVLQFKELIREKLGTRAVFAPSSLNVPRPSELALLAESLSPVPSIHHFVPDYLQLAEAEAKWQARQKESN
ncbi:MAG TPA: tRNA (adenosine(37)-N6)-threonylcarbamoyltransferase complex dimerization subunit type 1 TsaB [Candidatus Angelobacter sp.]|nr:tRNA (adenosine(37)-N6)-threonylcarbamoyltransferase complex dimerization subunit type 1 TsaB [Candidatus Angelobacter sp.]